jgi:hypothetical protein
MIRAMAAGGVAMTLCGGAAAETFVMEQGAPENLAKLIRGFNAVNVKIQPGSDRCGIRDANHYAGRLKDELRAVGLQESSDALTSAYLFIWARSFGIAGEQCAMFSSLRLGTNVSAAVTEMSTKEQSDGMIVDQMKTIQGTFPAAFFMTAKLGVKLEPSAAGEQDKIIQELVADLKAARGTASGSQ